MGVDVVYVVGRGPNPELRFSLRSLCNLTHGKVWVAGHLPAWVTGVGHIPVEQRTTKYANSTANLRAACEHPEVSEGFWYFNDDFFVTRPTNTVPTLHRGPVADVLADYRRRYRGGGPYMRGMVETADLLETLGRPNPLSYELHLPMYVHKARMLTALDLAQGLDVVHKRTLYGNLWHVGGVRTDDVKVTGHIGTVPDLGFVSTSNQSWLGRTGRDLRRMFPEPSPYERVEVAA